MRFVSTKTYGHEIGLSAAFRQWRAQSHCQFIHGYALCIRFEFEADELDDRNWVVDFGSLKGLKGWLETTFDHKLLVAEDDPQRAWFEEAGRRGLAQVVFVRATGCERFAELILECTEIWLNDNGYAPRVRVRSVEVKEHGANSAIAERPRVRAMDTRELQEHLRVEAAMDRSAA
jgi:6-pyruvoyltetrahydropterin/6-carboxytetrahydropterin synthase